MKKIIAIVVLLSLVSVGAFWGISNIVSEEKENVTIKENILYGDKAYAEGVRVFTRVHYNDHLFWNTAYTIGNTPKTTTTYEFHYSAYYEKNERRYDGLSLDLDLRYGFDLRKPVEECVGLQKAYRELFDETTPGTTGTKTIRLQDYYTYYPIRVGMTLPGVLWNGNDYDNLTFDDYKNERAVWDKFNEFFKIPIPKDLPAFEISVTKNAIGNEVGMGSSGQDFEYWLNPQVTYTNNRVFFSIGNKFYNRGKDSFQYVDTSLIPGGYGIYSFTYKNVRNSKNTQGNTTIFYPGYETGVEEDTLAMVFPLEQQAEVIYMTLSNDESKLLVFTKEYDVTYLTVIDIASMTEFQKLKITETRQYTFYEYDNCIVLSGWEYISVIEKQPDGLCRLAFTVPRMKEVNDTNGQKGVDTVMAFDGNKLVMIDRTGDAEFYGLPICGFTVAVYNRTGLVYYGEYENSLSIATNPYDYSYNCLPVKYAVSILK